ncbi:MAG: tyrosine-protein phosphatase, partial [Kiritimatiellae bacterium]|nr:tyrosine-protein phosphatase [Kiritimatiellia bacterium]
MKVYGSGGGGGSSVNNDGCGGVAGTGAGAGNSIAAGSGYDALANQGGGGGGSGYSANGNGGNGGSGIVVLRFLLEEEGETPEVPPTPASDWSEIPSLSKKIFNAGTAITVFNGVSENRTVTANYTADQIAALNPGTYTFRATASAAGVEPLVYEIDFWVLPADFSAANTIVCYGDSITYGDGAAEITIDNRSNYFDGRLSGKTIKANYQYYLAGMIDTKYNVIGQGKSQQWSDTILAWVGGVDTVSRFDATLPAGGVGVWTPTNIVFTADNPYGINGGLQYVRDLQYPHMLNGKYNNDGQLNYFAGLQAPEYPAFETYPEPSGVYGSMTGWFGDKRVRIHGTEEGHPYFSRKNTGGYGTDQVWQRVSTEGAETVIPAGTPFKPDTALVYNDAISVIFTGTNDEMGQPYWPASNPKDYTTYISMISGTVAKIPSGRYVVVSTVSGSHRSDEIESAFAKEFGEHHLNLYKLMELYGLKTAVKLDIMTQAEADATTWNTKSTGLMGDSVHPNEKGYQVIAYFLKQKLIELNYIEGERDTDINFDYVAKPTVDVTSFIYDGTEKVVIAEGENYTLTGIAKAINAGSYTVIITPNAGFGWSDGTIGAITINWTIEKTSVEPGQPDVGGGENPEVGSNLTIVSPADYSTVSTMSEKLKSIIQSADMLKTSTFTEAGTATRKMYSNEYCTNSLPVKLEWTGNAASYTVSVYRTRDLESGDAKALYSVTTSENSILYWDPEVGRNYTWTVDDGSSVAVGHFYTESGVPRLIYADKNGPDGPGMDCLNGRDLGGWVTTDGKVVKQSMIYRSAELETCSPTNSIGMRIEMPYLADVLGIKLDIDLRSTNEVLDTYLDYALYYSAWKDLEVSNISPDIPRFSAHLNAKTSFPSYSKAIVTATDDGEDAEKKRKAIWKVFEQFTIEENYPIIFHCAHGKDRAGTVGYILLSVLGVPADDAKRDFGLSWLYYVNEPMIDGYGYTPIDAAVLNFPSYGGATLKEQCENYLVVCARDAGVSESVAREKIAKFRSLMLEEPETKISTSSNETVTYTWTGNGGDNKWNNPANWASPEDSYGYPNAENAVVYFDSEVIANIDLGGNIYKAKPIFGNMCDVAFVNGTLNVMAESFTLGAADATVTLNSNAKIVATGALKILGTLKVVVPEGGRELPVSAASLTADTSCKINLDLTDFSAAGEVTIASFETAFDTAAALEYVFTVAGNTVADRGTITTPESKAIIYSQDKKTGVIALPNAVTGLVYTGEELVGVPAGEGYTLAGDYKAVNAGTYTAQVILKDGYTFSNQTDGTVTWTIAKANNEWVQNPEISLDTWNIGEAGGVLTPGVTKFGTVTATISKDGGEVQVFNGQLPTTKGNYVITYSASSEGTDNYNAISAGELTKSIAFTITANPSDLMAYAGYVTYPEPIFYVSGVMKLGEGTTTARIKYSINSTVCNNVKEVVVDENGYFRVNIPYQNAEDTLTWEVEVVNSVSSDVLTVAKSTIKRAGDPSRVTYKWRGKGANNKWRSLANWEGFSGTVGNNNPCCWGYPGGITTHIHFDQSTAPEGIDLEGQTWKSIDNGFFVFEENVFVKMKNGTLLIDGGLTTFENDTVGLIGANNSTLVLNKVVLKYAVDNNVTKYLIPAEGFTLVYEGDNTVDWCYYPQNANSKFVVRDGTLSGNSFSTKAIAGTHVVEISNGVWSVSQNVSNDKGIGAKVIFRDGTDREAQFKTSGSLKMYGTYDIKIPANGKTKPAVEAATLASCNDNSKIVLDVTDYKSATKVPLVKFTSTTTQTKPSSTLEAYADGVNVTSERGAKLTFEGNILYYSQNEVKDPVELETIEKPNYATTSFTYDGSEKVVVAEGENYTIIGTAKATNAGSYTATITPNEGFSWADGTTDAITVSWTIAKATNVWTTEPSITLTEWTVGETAGVLTAGVAKFGDVAVTINGEEFTQMPTAAGTYTITYTVADTANYSALAKTITFNIKAPVVEPDPDEPGPGEGEDEPVEPKLEIDPAVGYIVTDLGELKDQVAVVFTNADNYAWTMPKSAKNVEFLVVGG